MLASNIFQYNSGVKGIVYLEKSNPSNNSIVSVYNNSFYANLGFIDTSALFIRVYSSQKTCNGVSI